MRHGRTFPIKPHLAPAIVGAPIVVWLAPPAFVAKQATSTAKGLYYRKPLRPLTPPAIVGAAAAPPTDPLTAKAYIVGTANANQQAQQFRRLVNRGKFAPPLIPLSYAFIAPRLQGTAGSQAVKQARQIKALLRPEPHTAPAVVATSYTRTALRGQLITIRPGIEIDA